jgi:hypothetical protein
VRKTPKRFRKPSDPLNGVDPLGILLRLQTTPSSPEFPLELLQPEHRYPAEILISRLCGGFGEVVTPASSWLRYRIQTLSKVFGNHFECWGQFLRGQNQNFVDHAKTVGHPLAYPSSG